MASALHVSKEKRSRRRVSLSPPQIGFILGTVNMRGESSPLGYFAGLASEILIVASPARYFAAAELKTIFAQLVLDYDIKLDEKSPSLRTMWIGDINFPNEKATVMMRRRR